MTHQQDELITRALSVKMHTDTIHDILIDAGDIIRKWYETTSSSVQYKDDGSPLTMADTETNTYLHAGLSALLPEASWLSEESEDQHERLHADWVWVVDPLDGTKEFVRHIPEIAVSIGLVYRGAVILGAMVNPITGEGGIGAIDGDIRFWGIQNTRAAVDTLAESVASVSRTETDQGHIDPYLPHIGTVNAVGSVAYKLLRVAAGLDDLTFSVVPKNEWDICGGVGLLLAAGKAYRRLDDLPVVFNQRDPFMPGGGVAGPQALVDAFVEVHHHETGASP